MRCVVFGATGYIGGRLVPELLRAGHDVRAVARDPSRLTDVPWHDRAEIAAGDVTEATSVASAVAGQDVIYYLVHSLHRHDFVELDRHAARTVAGQAHAAGVRRIVYLGGITPDGQPLSPHLASRAEVGQIMLDSGVPTIALQAAVIIGAGSASFEMLRYLTERLPAMVTPRWVNNRVQPIAIRDVLHYLTHAAALPGTINRRFDIGGPTVLTYLDMMRRYAAVAGLPRRVIALVPVLTPWLSAQWVNLVTPVPHSIAVPLIESLVHEVVCHDRDITTHIPEPDGGPASYERAVELALAHIRHAGMPARRSGAAMPPSDPLPSDPMPSDPAWSGGSSYEDIRERHTSADAQVLWQFIESIGGEHDWCSFPLAWSPRGWLDRLIGGAGLRRGGHDHHRLYPGEALHRWRVEHLDRPRLLRLRAEMRLPGRAWLELSAAPDADGSLYRQRVIFEPHGLTGHLYWKAIAPFHHAVLGGMARAITNAAEREKRRGKIPR
ncbi:SDR family oxidoreductase [Frankia sp. CiP3]|uniref:SDR family oxidoreductase n=1 Tax=Frankia sp. CiP3 TaxID=2880971 RepID=UPI0035B3BDA1